MTGTRPNILFIISDDLRPDLGVYGSKVAQTPNMDALANAGALFENAFVSEAACAPSRAALLSGLRPDTTGITGLEMTDSLRNFAPDAVTMADTFKAAGYETLRIGKVYNDADDDLDGWSKIIPIAPQETNTSNNFDFATRRWPNRETTSDYGNALKVSAEFARLSKSSKPFFFAVGIFKPHMPFVAPSADWDRYDPAKFVRPKNAEGQSGAYSWSLTSDEIWAYNDLYPYRAPGTGVGSLPQNKATELIWGYLAAVSSVDYNVGIIIDALKANGLANNTIVVLLGDHGWKLGDHNYWGKKSNSDIDIRIPLIVTAPGRVTPGEHVKGIVEEVDIFPTLAEMAGVPVPPASEGLSFTSLLTSPDASWKSAAFAQFPRYAVETSGQGDLMGYTVRTANYRYTAWLRKNNGAPVGRELYDLVADPDETRNVATSANYRAVLANLEQMRIDGWKPVRTQLTGS